MSNAIKLEVATRPKGHKYGLSPEKLALLRAVGSDPAGAYCVCLRTLHSETERYLDSLTRCAREGKNLLPAADFARWVRFSGVLDFLTKFAPDDLNLPSLDRKITNLLDLCGEHFRGGRVDAKYSESDIAEINRKLDALTEALAVAKSRPVVSVVTQVHQLPHGVLP